VLPCAGVIVAVGVSAIRVSFLSLNANRKIRFDGRYERL
jgi:arginyl-tRNA synthetase